MKQRILLSATLLFFLTPLTLWAGDFAWIQEFNIRAQTNPSEFRAKIALRFHVGDAQIHTVLTHFPQPSDAYIALRLAEMSGKPMEDIITQYQARKGRGWGVVAKGLGIKPGSPEFHALKNGDDLYNTSSRGKGKAKGKNK
jgi:hypothetical protein